MDLVAGIQAEELVAAVGGVTREDGDAFGGDGGKRRRRRRRRRRRLCQRARHVRVDGVQVVEAARHGARLLADHEALAHAHGGGRADANANNT